MKLPWHDKKFLFLVAGVVIVIALEILSILGIEIPEPYAPFIFGAFILGFGYKVLWQGVKALFVLKFSSINLLMFIAVCAAFYLGEYPEAAVVITLYVMGEKLEDIGVENSKSALNNLVEKSPKTAVVKETGETLPIEDIQVGTIINIKPFAQIPLDGEIVKGETSVDEAAITGEPIPKEKNAGDTVFAGTLNKSGFIEVRTTKLSTDTTFAKILNLTFEAQANKSNSQKFIQRFAKYYTPSIILLATLLFVMPVFVFGGDLNQWLLQAITLLVIACPCALVISTPVAIYAAIGNASGKGILVKGGKYLEAMASVKAMGLDKTRTITYGKPIVSDIFPLNGTSHEELLACTAGLEIFSEHPLADAIVEASKKAGFEPHNATHFKSVAGKGATAQCLFCNNEKVLAGNLAFLKENHHVNTETEEIVKRLSAEGKTSVVVSFNHNVAGVIGLSDEIKPDSAESIRNIKELGVETIMFSGDNEHAARYTAAHVGIEKVFGNLLPEHKSQCIAELQKQYGQVAMVGDGVNDAPALALANVGIAMGAAGSDTALEVADIALMNDKLSLIPFLIKLSRKAVATIKLNTVFAISIKLIFIMLAFFGYSNLVFAISADVGVTLIVILISLRLMKA